MSMPGGPRARSSSLILGTTPPRGWSSICGRC
jgi:hypothetical protein